MILGADCRRGASVHLMADVVQQRSACLDPNQELTMKEPKGKPKKAQPPKANAAQPSQKGMAAAPAKPKK